MFGDPQSKRSSFHGFFADVGRLRLSSYPGCSCHMFGLSTYDLRWAWRGRLRHKARHSWGDFVLASDVFSFISRAARPCAWIVTEGCSRRLVGCAVLNSPAPEHNTLCRVPMGQGHGFCRITLKLTQVSPLVDQLWLTSRSSGPKPPNLEAKFGQEDEGRTKHSRARLGQGVIRSGLVIQTHSGESSGKAPQEHPKRPSTSVTRTGWNRFFELVRCYLFWVFPKVSDSFQ